MDIKTTDSSMFVNGKEIKFFADRNPLNCPWKEWGVDLVIESTGVFNTDEKASMHIQAGAKKVILTAPGKGDGVGTFVVGVNDDQYRHEDWDILSNASCTTNCLAPIVKVLDQNFGLDWGLMTTIHSYTGDQRILDNSHRDLRRARACGSEYGSHHHRCCQGCGSGLSRGEGQAHRLRHARSHPERLGC